MDLIRFSAAPAPTRDFRGAARHVFALFSRRLSSAAERLATSERETASDYPRFPWF